MRHEYTRQRQGRDFFNNLANVEMSVEGNYNNIDGIIGNAPPKDDSDERRDFLTRMERFKRREAERKGYKRFLLGNTFRRNGSIRQALDTRYRR